MTIDGLLKGSALPRLEAEVIAVHCFKKDRSWLLAHGSDEVRTSDAESVWKLFHRRAKGEPVAYIVGKKEFYGREFSVSPAVLIPRPSTEHLVSLALHFLKTLSEESREADSGIVARSILFRPSPPPTTIVDCGTGSGCIAVTLALETDLSIVATDVSGDALAVARENASRHGVLKRISFVEGRELSPVLSLDVPFIVVTNPPYIPLKAPVSSDLRYEPSAALFADEGGTAVLKSILRQAKAHPFCTGVVMECGEGQDKSLLGC